MEVQKKLVTAEVFSAYFGHKSNFDWLEKIKYCTQHDFQY